MNYREFPPPPALAPYVQSFWMLRAASNPFAGTECLIPDGTIELIFNFAAPYRRTAGRTQQIEDTVKGHHLVGTRAQYFTIEQFGAINHVAVRFRPGGLRPFLRVPLTELTDRIVDAAQLFGPSVRELEGRLFESGCDRQRMAILARYLCARLRRQNQPVNATLANAVQLIRRERGNLPVRDLARELGWTYKRLERLFLAQLGVTPKFFSKNMRFLTALRCLSMQTAPDWHAVTFAGGYYDQAHFIREFKEFTGYTPLQFHERRTCIADMLTPQDDLSNLYNT